MIIQNNLSASYPKYQINNNFNMQNNHYVTKELKTDNVNFKSKKLLASKTNQNLFQKLMMTFGFVAPGTLIIHELNAKNKKSNE